MAISTNAISVLSFDVQPHPVNAIPFCINAISADVTGNETVIAAPGTGKYLVITKVSIWTDEDITVQLNDHETAWLGPIPFHQEVTAAGYINGSQFTYEFKHPARLTANQKLAVDASAAGNVHILVEGYTT